VQKEIQPKKPMLTNCGANTILTTSILHSLSDVPFSVYYNDVWVARLPVRERYGHSAAMVDESTMAVYRGYSHECEDFCDDTRCFDFNARNWMMQQVGSGSNGPGRRWKFNQRL
jgi:hypothetical protein